MYVSAFKAHIQSCGAIPDEVKKILRKPAWNRSKGEVERVLRIVKRMKGFNRYPMFVKRELAKVLYYASYQAGRTVLRQGLLTVFLYTYRDFFRHCVIGFLIFSGHIGISFYFIVHGCVIVERAEEDKATGERHTQVAKMISYNVDN